MKFLFYLAFWLVLAYFAFVIIVLAIRKARISFLKRAIRKLGNKCDRCDKSYSSRCNCRDDGYIPYTSSCRPRSLNVYTDGQRKKIVSGINQFFVCTYIFIAIMYIILSFIPQC